MKEISVKPDPFGTNSKIPSGAWQQGMHVEWKARWRLSLSLDRGHTLHTSLAIFYNNILSGILNIHLLEIFGSVLD
jgi:hypothetical protein